MKSYFITYGIADGLERSRGYGDPEIQRLAAGVALITVSAANYQLDLADIAIADLRAAIWGAAKARRDAAIDGGAVTPVGAVDSDALSRTNLIGAYCAAKELGAAYAMDWTMLDNSVITIDASTMIGMALAVMSHVNACHGRARALRDTIEAAADLAALLAIDIHAGWPS